MKLIIDIPEEEYKYSYKRQLSYDEAIRNGVPLDFVIEDIKADIAEEICPTDNPYTKETEYTISRKKLLEIIDKHISGKGRADV